MLKLQEIREQKGILQKELAEKLNKTRACISSWETSKTEPDLQSLVQIANVLEVTTDYLLGRENDLGVVNVNASLTPFQSKLLDVVDKLPRDDQFQVLGFAQALAN